MGYLQCLAGMAKLGHVWNSHFLQPVLGCSYCLVYMSEVQGAERPLATHEGQSPERR